MYDATDQREEDGKGKADIHIKFTYDVAWMDAFVKRTAQLSGLN